MSNGLNQPIQFTRGDAERLSSIETEVKNLMKHISKIIKFGYVVGVSMIASAIGVFTKIVLFSP